MLVMALAHARKSGDITLISKYQDVLYKWSDFLVTNSLRLNGSYVESPSPRPLMKLSVFSSMTADGLVGATSNLALKGIMGIYAMGEIVKLLESRSRNSKRATYYLVSSFPSLFWQWGWDGATGHSKGLCSTMAKQRILFGPRRLYFREQLVLGNVV